MSDATGNNEAMALEVEMAEEGDPQARAVLFSALIKAQAEMEGLTENQEARIKSEKGRSYTYGYADLAAVLGVVRPALNRHGFALIQSAPKIEYRDRGAFITVITEILHASGESLSQILTMPSDGLGIKDLGSALTYARRYALLLFFGLAPESDDDGARAQAPSASPDPSLPLGAGRMRGGSEGRGTQGNQGNQGTQGTQPAELIAILSGEDLAFVNWSRGKQADSSRDATERQYPFLAGVLDEIAGEEGAHTPLLEILAGRPVSREAPPGMGLASSLLDFLAKKSENYNVDYVACVARLWQSWLAFSAAEAEAEPF